MSSIASQITGVSIAFTQPFVQAQITENIKAPRHWPLLEEFTGEFPAQRASNAENVSNWWRHHDNSNSRTVLPIMMKRTNVRYLGKVYAPF